MRQPRVFPVLVASLVLAACFPSAADEEEGRRRIAAIRELIDSRKIRFHVDGSREAAIRKLAAESGVAIAIPDPVPESMLQVLQEPVAMAHHGSTIRDLLGSLLWGTRLFPRITAEGVSLAVLDATEDLSDGPGPGVVLLATLTEVDDIRFSGIVGKTFWFKLERVIRFRRGTKALSAGEEKGYFEVLKRNADLEQYFLLQSTLTFKGKDEAGAKLLAEMSEPLKIGQRYLLAADSVLDVGARGMVGRAHNWGSISRPRLQVATFAGEEDLARIDEHFK